MPKGQPGCREQSPHPSNEGRGGARVESGEAFLAEDRLPSGAGGLAVALVERVDRLQSLVQVADREGVESEIEPQSEAEKDQAVKTIEDHADQKGPGLAFAGEFPEDKEHTGRDQRNNESGCAARRAGDFADPVGDLRN